MSESLRLAEYAWDDAESFVDRMESLCHRGVDAESFYRQLVDGIAETTHSTAVSLWQLNEERTDLLARHGVDAGDDELKTNESDQWSPIVSWPTGDTMVAVQKIAELDPGRHRANGNGESTLDCDAASLVLRLGFDGNAELNQRQPIEDMCAAVLSITALVWLRTRYGELVRDAMDRDERDQKIGSLYRGETLADSLTNVASVIARHADADRVAILRMHNGRSRLMASSAATRIDHRSRHVRCMQQLVDQAAGLGDCFSHVVGQDGSSDSNITDALQAYIDESGCRELLIRQVAESETDKNSIAAIVLERFRLPDETSDVVDRLGTRDATLSDATADATREAFRRDRHIWRRLVSRWTSGHSRIRIAITACLLTAMATAMVWVPVDFSIPVDGRLVAKKSSHLFAPYDANVESIAVSSGQRVKAGEVLMVLTSPPLQRQEKSLAGELATYQSQLAALQASKSSGGSDTRLRDSASRGDQRVLESMIASLHERLKVLRQQQDSLTIRSPIDGLAQRSDLQESLASRPVARGQRLMNVVAPEAGWALALDIPDDESGYLVRANRSSPVLCRFRLRSDPANVYHGQVRKVENTTHITPRGKSVVRAHVELTEPATGDGAGSFRVGATVMANLQCGRRAAGFVWFRSLVEWFREQSW